MVFGTKKGLQGFPCLEAFKFRITPETNRVFSPKWPASTSRSQCQDQLSQRPFATPGANSSSFCWFGLRNSKF